MPKTGISARHTISAASAQSYNKNSRLSQYTTGMEKCKEKVEKRNNFVKNISNRKFGGSMVYLEKIWEEA